MGAPINDPFEWASRGLYPNGSARTFFLPKPIGSAAEAYFTSGIRAKWCLTRDGSTPVIADNENQIGTSVASPPVFEFFGFVSNISERLTGTGTQTALSISCSPENRP